MALSSLVGRICPVYIAATNLWIQTKILHFISVCCTSRRVCWDYVTNFRSYCLVYCLLFMGSYYCSYQQCGPIFRCQQTGFHWFSQGWLYYRSNLDRLDHADCTNGDGFYINWEAEAGKLWALLVYAPPLHNIFLFLVIPRRVLHDQDRYTTILFWDWRLLALLDVRRLYLPSRADYEGGSRTP